MQNTNRIAEILAQQDGVIARSQALKREMTPAQVRYQLTSGRWIQLHPGVYRSTEHQLSTQSRVRAVVLWGGPNAFLSGHAAAWWWGLTTIHPGRVEIVIPRNEGRRERPGTRVIRRPLPFADRAQVRRAQVTNLALSVVVGAVALGDEGPALLDRALQTRVSFAEVRAAHYRSLGIEGSTRAGYLLRAAADRSAAESERIFVRLLKAAGINGFTVNYLWDPESRSTVDVAFVLNLVAIEIDGWAWHHAPDRFQRDRRKQNDLVAQGWTVLRFTWSDLTTRPDHVVRRVRDALRRTNPDPRP